MSDHSEHLRDEGEEDGNAAHSPMSILSEIIRPVFHHLDSRIDLIPSNFLHSSFKFPSESLTILNESFKGYIQFSLTWKKDEQSLNFVPMEKVEDYYPEEIEEEVIIPYRASDNRATVHRKLTSYPSNLIEQAKLPIIDSNNNNNNDIPSTLHNPSDKLLPKVISRNSAVDDKPAINEFSSEKKSLKNIAFRKKEEKEQDDGIAINKRREFGSSAETKKYLTSKTTSDSIFKSTTPSFRTDSSSKMKSPFKHRSDMQNLDHADFTPQVTDPSKNDTASSYPNDYVSSSPLKKQEQPKKPPAARGTFPSTLKPSYINRDIDNNPSEKIISNSGMKPLGNNINSFTDHPSTLENDDLAKIRQRTKYTFERDLSHNEKMVPHNLEKGSADENNKHLSTHAHTGLSAHEQKKDLPTNSKTYHEQNSMLVSRATDGQKGQGISSTIDSLNIHRIGDDSLPLQDSTTQSTNFKGISRLQALKKNPAIRNAFDTASISDSSNMITETDKVVDSPAITINRLDVTVVGDSRGSADTGNSSIEAEERTDETNYSFSEEGLELLNKSYLWKYKVKF